MLGESLQPHGVRAASKASAFYSAERRSETAGYLGAGSDVIYYVRHSAVGSVRGTVLLCGGLALEATHSALVWTHLARTIAEAGWNAIRFDWRGTGESAGEFSDIAFDGWLQDVRRMCEEFGRCDVPTVLLGLRGGALVAARAFADGIGSALVLWEPPASGRAYLMDLLRRKLTADYVLDTSGPRKTREQYVAELEAGGTVEVEGSVWTKTLWASMGGVELATGGAGPRLVVSTRTHKLPRPAFWQDAIVLRPDVTEWFNATLGFLRQVAGKATVHQPPREPTTQASFERTDRTIIPLECEGMRLVATYHAPKKPSRIGILLGNFGYVPRSGQGGLAVRLCDELAASGVHGIRLDLPALGDAAGELPTDSAAWFAAVRGGALTTPTLEAIRYFGRRFEIDQFVIGGLCAASITALFAFERDPQLIKGLLLLEPEFFTIEGADAAASIPQTIPPSGPIGWAARGRTLVRGLFTRWTWMRIVTGESELARHLPIPRRLVERLLTLQQHRLPARSNLPLIAAWQNAVRRRVPTLVVTAEGKMRELFFEQVNQVAVPGYHQLLGQAIEHVRMPGTNHTFTTGGATGKVTEVASRWVTQRFC